MRFNFIYEKEDWKTIIIQYTEHNSMRFNFNCEKEDWKTIIIQYMNTIQWDLILLMKKKIEKQ